VKLTSIVVKNYRSVYAENGRPLTVELAAGMNAFAGPNNCGKSNLLRAVALALDRPFSRQQDTPEQMAWATPRVTLEFRQTKKRGPEATLFKRAHAYERSVLAASTNTFADEGVIRYQVSFPGSEESGATRQDIFVIRGKGSLKGNPALLDKALRQLREVVQFVMVESGSDLQELLRGKFRDVLHTVIGWHLREELASARGRHGRYVRGLQDDLLAPLASHIAVEIKELFPEIDGVELVPNVRSIEETLEEVAVLLTDDAATDLAGKGTGVRGGVLMAMLRYLAEQSRRSMIFAIEEPEAFLHPAAQETLRDDLDALAERDDVTTLITTHSPYIVSREQKAQLVSVEKDARGRTRIEDVGRGGSGHDRLLAGLFRDRGVAAILDRACTIPPEAAGIVLVEGTTDADYLELAAAVLRAPELLADLHIVPSRGAKEIVVEAVVTRALTCRPILILLDSDVSGKAVHDQLTGTTFGFDKRRQVLTYAAAFDKGTNVEVEAEDLFPSAVIERFVERHGYGEVCTGQRKISAIDQWHYDLNKMGKERLPDHLRRVVTRASQVRRWEHLLYQVRGRLGLARDT
jgi:predicted ATPase